MNRKKQDQAEWDAYDRREAALASRKVRGRDDVKWLDAMHGTAQSLRHTSQELSALANAFYTTGNREMGDRLHWIGRELEVDSQNVNDLTGMKVHEQYSDSMRATSQMLAAVVGGVALGGNLEMADDLAPVLAPDMARKKEPES